jgi:hypothetical protein
MICINNIFDHFKWWQFFLSLAEQPRGNLFMTTELKKDRMLQKKLLLKKWIGQFSSKLVTFIMATWKLYTLPWHQIRNNLYIVSTFEILINKTKTFLFRNILGKLKNVGHEYGICYLIVYQMIYWLGYLFRNYE